MKQIENQPFPNVDMWNWQINGKCRGMDSSIFFHPDGERGRARAEREQRAKITCKSCPVLVQCREHALNIAEPYGVWGGLSETERGALLGRRNRRIANF